MLTKLMAMTKAELKSKLQAIDVAGVKGRSLRRKFETIRNKKEGGFTLLELLVVVAILAAIAGTATIMLQDTDRKGMAAAHVAMMDELSKGIQTFRVLNSGAYPNNWDSLLQNGSASLTGATALEILNSDLSAQLTVDAYTDTDISALSGVGIDAMRVINTTADGCTAGDIASLITSKDNDVVAQNIFRDPIGTVAAGTRKGGCGAAVTTLATGDAVMLWSGGNGRVNAETTDRLLAFGVGPDSSLFNPSTIGALSNVPVYRHVENNEYNRFVVLFNTSTTGGQATFQAIIDGAGDTKDEELGEVDNVRPT